MRLAFFLAVALPATVACSQPYQTCGIKIGEVTLDSAVVWTRLCAAPDRVGDDAPLPEVSYMDETTGAAVSDDSRSGRRPVVRFPEGTDASTIAGAVPGAPGETRVLYSADGAEWKATAWEAVDAARDFTRQITLDDLAPDTRYALKVESRAPDGAPGETVEGGFRTSPREDAGATVRFAVSTGQRYPHRDSEDGFKIYDAMLPLDPHFFVHTGDILYYDELAKTEALARWHWQRMYSLPSNVHFHNRVASYFIKDDHDTWQNDCWPGMDGAYMGEFTFAQGQAIFLEQVPMRGKTYRTHRWGRDLQIWLVEGRDFRSPNTMPDGPAKTIWGEEQMRWFMDSVRDSDATFRILISPTPIVGPDRAQKADNHANLAFKHEGDRLRAFLAGQPDLYVVCGDRHWQYASVDKATGLREYSCGPASDAHAGGWNQGRLPEHRYLKVVGGFLSVEVARENDAPFIAFRHHNVAGKVLNEEKFGAAGRK